MQNKQLVEDLFKLGLCNGDNVLVHSSLSSLGTMTNKASMLCEALLEVLGREGTLLVPALSYRTVTKDHPYFDHAHTPSCVGGFTEFFRKFPGTYRSIHPTHSVCAYGKNAEMLTRQHLKDKTPVGPNSPFRLLQEMDGTLLFIGCGLKPNTSMHGVEELSQPPYLYGPEVTYRLKLSRGETVAKSYITHGFDGYEQRYDRIWKLLDNCERSSGMLLDAEAFLIQAKALWVKGNQQLVADPFYFVDKA
ncbi:AAC(3) family N-acetyltransferase [Pleomorphovibrio marinus]|uniref:AAC(3) family N-acetyltransferase n=1 Tax=Pleomorphovibrio marinus TaxID=2164132 RepID=UPI000E0B52B2|nr:AAC(3) family N-acetyltransferase [Pleomorphovibrio marinus]